MVQSGQEEVGPSCRATPLQGQGLPVSQEEPVARHAIGQGVPESGERMMVEVVIPGQGVMLVEQEALRGGRVGASSRSNSNSSNNRKTVAASQPTLQQAKAAGQESQPAPAEMRLVLAGVAAEGQTGPRDTEIAVSVGAVEAMVRRASVKIAEGHCPGMTVCQATALLSSEELEVVQSPAAQVALLGMAARLGEGSQVQRAVLQEVASNKQAVRTVGLTALLQALETSCTPSTEVLATWQTEDFQQAPVAARLPGQLSQAVSVTSWQAEETVSGQAVTADQCLQAVTSLVAGLQEGRQVAEIVSSSSLASLEAMQCLETQMALVGSLERLGLATVSQQVVLEQPGGQRAALLNTVGSRAVASVLSKGAVTGEEVLACLEVADLRPEVVTERLAQLLCWGQPGNTAQVAGLAQEIARNQD